MAKKLFPKTIMHLLDLDYEAPLDKDLQQFGIGVIGAGFIIRNCHLVAYLQTE